MEIIQNTKKELLTAFLILSVITKLFANEPGTQIYFGRFYGYVDENNQITRVDNNFAPSDYYDRKTFRPELNYVTIPEEVDGMKVVSIEKEAFSGNADIKYVYIPATVTDIGYKAFNACHNIESFVIDSKNPVYEAKDGIIYEKATKKLVSCYYGKTGIVKVPEGTKEIPADFFSGNIIFSAVEFPLPTVILPESVTSIGDKAFTYSRFKEIKFPKNIKSLGQKVFNYIEIENLSFPNGPETISEETFSHASIENLYLPDTVTVIGSKAFEDCMEIFNIRMPNNLKRIESYAFHDFRPIYERKVYLNLPESLEFIGEYAFMDAYFAGIKLPDSMETINKYAFSNIGNYWSEDPVKLPKNLKRIEEGAFEETSFNSFNLPEGLVYIGEGAFSHCGFGDLDTDEIILPDSIEYIGKGAFEHSALWAHVYLPASLKTIEERVFANSVLKSLRIPEGVTEIKESACEGCISLSYVEIPKSVTKIGNKAFAYCENLREVDCYYSSKLQSVGNQAFYECPNLKKIELPYKVWTFGKQVVSKGTKIYRLK